MPQPAVSQTPPQTVIPPLGQSIPMFHPPLCEEILPKAQPKPLWDNSRPFSLLLSLFSGRRARLPSRLTLMSGRARRSPLSLLLFRQNNSARDKRNCFYKHISKKGSNKEKFSSMGSSWSVEFDPPALSQGFNPCQVKCESRACTHIHKNTCTALNIYRYFCLLTGHSGCTKIAFIRK